MNRLGKFRIWIKRVRYRKGYGVHSPFAFNLITWVIYEKYPFYKCRDLAILRNKLRLPNGVNSEKIDKLLFRLVNYVQPNTIIETSTAIGLTTLYLCEARTNKVCFTFDTVRTTNVVAQELLDTRKDVVLYFGDILSNMEKVLSDISCIDFLYLKRTDCIEQIFCLCLDKVTSRSLFVIEGIYASPEMKKWWEKVKENERTGITFDLYEIGLVFFDTKKIKQHYIVNF